MSVLGSCQCKSVKYELLGKLNDVVHCHCQSCQKAHSSAFSSVMMVKDDDFNLINSESIKFFESSVGKKRYFCGDCGSQIYAKKDGTEHVVLRMGLLDSNVRLQEEKHIWVSQSVDWFNFKTDVKCFEQFE